MRASGAPPRSTRNETAGSASASPASRNTIAVAQRSQLVIDGLLFKRWDPTETGGPASRRRLFSRHDLATLIPPPLRPSRRPLSRTAAVVARASAHLRRRPPAREKAN